MGNPLRQLLRTLPVVAGYLLLQVAPAAAQAGLPDPTFGTDGRVVSAVGDFDDFAQAIAVASDDRIVVAGYSTTEVAGVVTNEDPTLLRLRLDGSLDPDFGTGGRVRIPFGSAFARALALAIQPTDHKIVLAGFRRVAGNEDFLVARLLPGGGLDPDFGTGGLVTTAIGLTDERANAVAVGSDGRIVVGGWALRGSNKEFAVVRYLADGTLDPSFGDAGKEFFGVGTGNDEIAAIALRDDGRILLAGHAADGGQYGMALVRLTDAGALDSDFGGGSGIVRPTVGTGDSYAYAVALLSGGGIAAVGKARTGTQVHMAVLRFDASGALDPGFDGDGVTVSAIGTSSRANAVADAGSGRIAVAGVARIGGVDQVALARYGATGALDSGFGTGGVVTAVLGNGAAQANAIAVQRDRKLLVAGVSRTGNDDDFAVLRWLQDACGNGQVDAGETCDAGAAIESECCSIECTAAPSDKVCRPSVDECDIVEFCDGSSGLCPADTTSPDGDGDLLCDIHDNCPADPNPDQADGDDDQVGDVCDPCTGGVEVIRSRLKLANLGDPAGDDKFRFEGTMRFPGPVALEPDLKPMRVVLRDASGATLCDALLPTGSAWTSNDKRTIWGFISTLPVDGWIDSARLVSSGARPEEVKFIVGVDRASLGRVKPVLPLAATIVLDGPFATSGLCGNANYPGGSTRAPTCRANPPVTSVFCK